MRNYINARESSLPQTNGPRNGARNRQCYHYKQVTGMPDKFTTSCETMYHQDGRRINAALEILRVRILCRTVHHTLLLSCSLVALNEAHLISRPYCTRPQTKLTENSVEFLATTNLERDRLEPMRHLSCGRVSHPYTEVSLPISQCRGLFA